MDLIKDNKAWIDETWGKVEKKMFWLNRVSGNKIPYTTFDGQHDDWSKIRIGRWTNGFWGGINWLMYVATKKEEYKEVALLQEKLMDEALADIPTLHHDVGFMWEILSGVNYRVNGDEDSKKRVLLAASTLASRLNLRGEYIKAWNFDWSDGYVIIDTMMNLPLLYLASDIVKDDRFKQVAMMHADTAMKNHVRPDGSVFHILQYDIESGECMGAAPTCQGYDPQKSAWSRGQAWAIYGFVLSYIYSGKKEYLDTAKKVAHYFVANVCLTDYTPMCDFRCPDEPVIIDTTAGACAACGLIEIANHVDEYEKNMYLGAAIKILKSMEKHCNWTKEEQGILMDGTSAYNCTEEHHISIIYGDYYFIEALYKLRGNKLLFW